MRITHIDVDMGTFRRHKCRYKKCQKSAECRITVGERIQGYYCYIHRANVLAGLLGIAQNHKREDRQALNIKRLSQLMREEGEVI